MFSQLARYASELNVPIEDVEMGLRMSYDTRGKLLLEDVSPAALNRGGFPFDSFPNLRDWYQRITERPAFEAAITAAHRWGNSLDASPAVSGTARMPS